MQPQSGLKTYRQTRAAVSWPTSGHFMARLALRVGFGPVSGPIKPIAACAKHMRPGPALRCLGCSLTVPPSCEPALGSSKCHGTAATFAAQDEHPQGLGQGWPGKFARTPLSSSSVLQGSVSHQRHPIL